MSSENTFKFRAKFGVYGTVDCVDKIGMVGFPCDHIDEHTVRLYGTFFDPKNQQIKRDARVVAAEQTAIRYLQRWGYDVLLEGDPESPYPASKLWWKPIVRWLLKFVCLFIPTK